MQVTRTNMIDITGPLVPGEIIRMYDQLAAVREAVGPKIDLCVDMHGRYDHVTAQTIAKKVEDFESNLVRRANSRREF